MSLSNDGNSFLCSRGHALQAVNHQFTERRWGRKQRVFNILRKGSRRYLVINFDDMAVRLRWYLSEGGVYKRSINGGSLPLKLL
jgi:hypothetical protein